MSTSSKNPSRTRATASAQIMAPSAPSFTRQEVAPLAVELFKICKSAHMAAEQAISLLEECDRALERRAQASAAEKAKQAAATLLPAQKDRLPVGEKWLMGLPVKAGEIIKHATDEPRADRAKAKFAEYAESKRGPGKWDAESRAIAQQRIATFWPKTVKNSHPFIPINKNAILWNLLLEMGCQGITRKKKRA